MNGKSVQLTTCHLLVLLNLTLIATLGSWTHCLPANALLRQHYETANLPRYHAQDSIKDSNGHTWQVLLFPKDYNANMRYYLRLVGFPGIESFLHPQSLEIITNQGQTFTVADAYQELAPAPNVGQYELTEIIPQLIYQKSLKLVTTLKTNRDLSLKIPRDVITEWRLLTQELELKQ